MKRLLIAMLLLCGVAQASTTNDGRIPTYSATFKGLVPASGATDIIGIRSTDSTKVIKIKQIELSGNASSAGNLTLSVIRRSTFNTVGTSTIATNAPYDTTDASAVAFINGYTANPTLGTSVVTLGTYQMYLPPAASTVYNAPLVIDLGGSQAGARNLSVRGTEQIVINCNQCAVSGQTINANVIWTEE